MREERLQQARVIAGGAARGIVRGALLILLLVGVMLPASGCSVFEPTYQAPPGENGEPGALVELEFVGNDSVGSYRLRQEIEDYLYDLSRQPQREALAFDAAEDLQQLYVSLGYPDAQVRYDLVWLEPKPGEVATVKVRFVVDEGPQFVVRSLQLVGNHDYSDDELGAMWQREQSGVLGFGEPIFVANDLEGYAHDLERFYRAHGHLEAKVAEPVIERLPNQPAVTVRIAIEEGPVYHHGKTVVADELLEALGDDRPSPPVGIYQRRNLQDFAFEIRARLQNRGYPDPKVKVDTHEQAADHLVEGVITGSPGRRATIGEIVVIGNDKTNRSTILSRMPLEPGDRYDGSKEQEGLRLLYLSGLFHKVEIQHDWIDDDTIRMEIYVDEIDSRSIELLAGYGSYEQLRGGVRFEELNVFGTGRQIAVVTRASLKGYRVGATLTDPYLFGTETTGTIGGEYFQRKEPSFTDKAFGLTVALSRRLAQGLTTRVGYSFRDHSDASAEVAALSSRFVDYREGRLFAELRNDRRDNPLFPKHGHEEFLFVDGMDPSLGADVSFVRTKLGGTLHIPLWDPARLVLRTEQGWLWPQDGSAQVPLQERFYNGGEDTVRSFMESELGPKDPSGKPVGGEYFNLFSIELRQPVWKTLELAAFVDAGNVGREVEGYSLNGMRYAIGPGLRFVLPIGPLRLDAGWNPDRKPGEDEWVVHFSVGYPF